MTTLAQDADRLRGMMEEVAEISTRIQAHIKTQTREDRAFNVHAVIGGTWCSLEQSARWIDGLDRELERDLS